MTATVSSTRGCGNAMEGGGSTTWTASHVIPDGGLSAWASPDPARPPVAHAAAGLEVCTLETSGDWSRVAFANGWEAWVDGRPLQPIQPRSLVIPAGGLAAWASPDPSQPPVTQVAAGLEVQILDTSGDWAHVEFTNGWSAWVDGRVLAPAGAGTMSATTAQLPAIAGAPRRITPLPAIGAALIVLGSFLPWATAGGDSISAWDIPVWSLLTHDPSTSPLKLGPFLLILLVACLPYVTGKPFPPLANIALGALGTLSAMAGALLISTAPGASLGIGLVAAYLGGTAITCEHFVTRRRRR